MLSTVVDDLGRQDLGLEGWIAGELYRVALGNGLAGRGFDDLRPADWPIIRYLHHRSWVTVGELAEAFGVSKQAASQAIAGLVERDYVIRRGADGDRRRREVALGSRGEAAHAAAVAVADDVEQQLVADAGAEALDGWRAVNAAMARRWLAVAPARVRIATEMTTGRS
jgi:DNA-binding MarR family transcriptional regulator